jgi:hypothetical protein
LAISQGRAIGRIPYQVVTIAIPALAVDAALVAWLDATQWNLPASTPTLIAAAVFEHRAHVVPLPARIPVATARTVSR